MREKANNYQLSSIKIIILISAFLFETISGTFNKEVAVITRLKGFVSVKYSSEQEQHAVTAGYLLYPGAIVQTSSNSIAQIQFIHAPGTIYLRPLSEIKVAVPDSSYLNQMTVLFNNGEIIADITKSPLASFDITTPTSLANVQNARCMAVISPNSDASTFYSLDGDIKIADFTSDRWTTIKSQYSSLITADRFIYIDSLSTGDLKSILESINSTCKLLSTDRLVLDLAVQSDSGGSTEPEGHLAVLNGTGIDLIAKPDAGFTFMGWQLKKGTARILSFQAETTQIISSSSAELSARFAKNPSKFTIKVKGNGTIDPSTEFYFEKGEKVILQAVPDTGFIFSGWKNPKNCKLADKFSNTIEVKSTASGCALEAHFTKKQSTVIMGFEGKGIVLPKNGKKKNVRSYGDTVFIEAHPDSGYRFIEWKLSGGKATIINPRDTMTAMICDSGNIKCTAIFTNRAVEISIIPDEHAAVSPRGNYFVPKDADLVVHANPDTGFIIAGWDVVRGKTRIRGTDEAYVKCTAPFEIQPVTKPISYNLTLQQSEGGDISPKDNVKALHGIPLPIQASPDKGKLFVHWNVTGGWAKITDFQKESTTVVLSKTDASISAVFATSICTLRVESTKGGYTEPAEVIKSTEGGRVALQAMPNPNAAFLYWEIIKGKENILFSDTVTSPALVVSTLRDNAHIRAVFSTEAVPLTVVNNGRGTTEPKSPINVVKNTWIPIKAIAKSGSSFQEWIVLSGSDIDFKDKTNPETEVFVGSSKTVIKAIFGKNSHSETNVHISDSISHLQIEHDKAKGIVEPHGTLQLQPGELISLKAEPKPGYRFVEWKVQSGLVSFSDRLGTSTTASVIYGNATISAVFEIKPIHNLEVQFKDSNGKTKTITTIYQ